MSEHPVFESMRRQIRHQELLPLKILLVTLWWTILALVWSMII